jgi:hypothetical protein
MNEPLPPLPLPPIWEKGAICVDVLLPIPPKGEAGGRDSSEKSLVLPAEEEEEKPEEEEAKGPEEGLAGKSCCCCCSRRRRSAHKIRYIIYNIIVVLSASTNDQSAVVCNMQGNGFLFFLWHFSLFNPSSAEPTSK